MSRKKAGMSANAKWGIAFLIEIVVMFFMVVGYFFFYANRKLDNINRPTNWDDSKENLDINEDANEATEGISDNCIVWYRLQKHNFHGGRKPK